MSEEFQVSLEVELAVTEGLFESSKELATKDFSQNLLGKEVVIA